LPERDRAQLFCDARQELAGAFLPAFTPGPAILEAMVRNKVLGLAAKLAQQRSLERQAACEA